MLTGVVQKLFFQETSKRPFTNHVFTRKDITNTPGVTTVRSRGNNAVGIMWDTVTGSRSGVTATLIGTPAQPLTGLSFDRRAADMFQYHHKLEFVADDLRGFVRPGTHDMPYRLEEYMQDQLGDALRQYAIGYETACARALLTSLVPYGDANKGYLGPSGNFDLKLPSTIANTGTAWSAPDADILGSELNFLKLKYYEASGEFPTYALIGNKIKTALLNNDVITRGFLSGAEGLARAFMEQERTAASGDPFANAIYLGGLFWVNIDPLGTVGSNGVLTTFFSLGGAGEDVLVLLPGRDLMRQHFWLTETDVPVPSDDGRRIEWARPGIAAYADLNKNPVAETIYLRNIWHLIVRDPTLVQKYDTNA
jgi:hypothetical protein